MELLVKPWRMSAFGEPPSIAHSVVVPSGILHRNMKPGVGIDHLNFHDRAFQFHRVIYIELGGEGVVGEQRDCRKSRPKAASAKPIGVFMAL